MDYDAHAFVLSSFVCTAFLSLMLVTFSVPTSSSLYFLSTSEAGGVRFGIWGWCLNEDGTCLDPPQLGYTWEPQIPIPVTGSLVFYPIAAVLTFFALMSLLPMIYTGRTEKTKRIFLIFVFASFLASLLAFIFMMAMWNVARIRFHEAGFRAEFGPLPWLSLAVTLLLLGATLISRRTIHEIERKSALYSNNSLWPVLAPNSGNSLWGPKGLGFLWTLVSDLQATIIFLFVLWKL